MTLLLKCFKTCLNDCTDSMKTPEMPYVVTGPHNENTEVFRLVCAVNIVSDGTLI